MNKKKRVIFVGSFLESGKEGNVGGQMYASKLLIQSKLSEFVDWLLIDSTAPSNVKIKFQIRIWKAFIRILILLKYLIFKKTDVALIFTGEGMSFLEKGFMALLAKSFGKKVILAPRSGYLKQNIESKGLIYWFIKLVFAKVDYVICQGKSWHQLFSAQIYKNQKKLVTISNWIDSSIYRKNSGKGETIIITFLAWVDRAKGVYETIKLGSYLKGKYNVQLIIAGNGKDFESVEKIIKEEQLENIIKLKGWVTGEEKISLLADSHIFILPSYVEGLPNALLEAMASELACVATEVGSIPDVIHHGKNGLLIKPMNENDLILKVSRLLDNPEEREKLGRAAKESIALNHNIHKVVQKFKELIIN